MSESASTSSFLARTMRRRSFFRVAGATVAASTLVLAGCSDPEVVPQSEIVSLSLGSDETGVNNYLFLLEQLEAAFYQKVVETPPADLLAGELVALTELRDHEIIHREFYRQLLGANGIGIIEFLFTPATFATRASVLATARTFEDLGVAAYNGAAKLLTTKATLELVAKIASVEARHAAFIRDLVLPNAPFTDVVETTGAATGMGSSLTPAQVLEAIKGFLPYTIIATGLPTA